MLRDRSLIPLSRQHQHALALCVRLDRAYKAGEVDPPAWQSEIQQIFEQEISVHFAAEEKEVFPAAARFPELQALVSALLEEHASLRDLFARAAGRTLDAESLKSLADKLSAHIRTEERQLFEEMQKVMSQSELSAMGAALERALSGAASTCILPNEATRVRPLR